jgi:hypothetical protein
MSSTSESPPVSKAMFWSGWIVSILPCLMLFMSATMKFLKPPEVVQGVGKLGFPESTLLGLGIIEVVSTVLYLIPQTSVLGAILLTGYLGGATCAHLRVGENFAFPVILGVVVWLGLFLRDPRIRALIPFRTSLRKFK